MQRVKKLYWNGVTKGIALKGKLNEAMNKGIKGDSNFLSILILMIIVVGVGFIFKDQITALVNSVTGKTSTKVDSMF